MEDTADKIRKRVREAKKAARPGECTSPLVLEIHVLRSVCSFVNVFDDSLKLTFVFIPELTERGAWAELNYAKNFDLSHSSVKDNVPRIDADRVSVEEFIEKFEKPSRPVVILNVQRSWQANEKWTLEVMPNCLIFYLVSPTQLTLNCSVASKVFSTYFPENFV